jgi:hypothetical protein
MDSFLTKLYEEEQVKLSSAKLDTFMDSLGVDELREILGLEKRAAKPDQAQEPKLPSMLPYLGVGAGAGAGMGVGGGLLLRGATKHPVISRSKAALIGAAFGLPYGALLGMAPYVVKHKKTIEQHLKSKTGSLMPPQPPLPTGAEKVEKVREGKAQEVHKLEKDKEKEASLYWADAAGRVLARAGQ